MPGLMPKNVQYNLRLCTPAPLYHCPYNYTPHISLNRFYEVISLCLYNDTHNGQNVPNTKGTTTTVLNTLIHTYDRYM